MSAFFFAGSIVLGDADACRDIPALRRNHVKKAPKPPASKPPKPESHGLPFAGQNSFIFPFWFYRDPGILTKWEWPICSGLVPSLPCLFQGGSECGPCTFVPC